MDKSIFREKNVESISSPDSLNDYIRVVRPSVWATLIAVILLLLGVTYWGVVGRLNSVIPAAVVSEGERVLVYVEEKDALEMKQNASVTVNGYDYQLKSDDYNIVVLTDKENGAILKLLNNPDNTKARVFELNTSLSKGVYKGNIVVESVRPISYVTN